MSFLLKNGEKDDRFDSTGTPYLSFVDVVTIAIDPFWFHVWTMNEVLIEGVLMDKCVVFIPLSGFATPDNGPRVNPEFLSYLQEKCLNKPISVLHTAVREYNKPIITIKEIKKDSQIVNPVKTQ